MLFNETFLFLNTPRTVALSCPFSLATSKVPKAFAFLKCQFGSATKWGFGTSTRSKLWKFYFFSTEAVLSNIWRKHNVGLSRCVFSELGLPKNATAGSVKPCAVHVWVPEIALRAAGMGAFCLQMIKGRSPWTGAHCNQDGARSVMQQHLQGRTGQSKSACIFKTTCGFILASLLLTLLRLKNEDISSHIAVSEDDQQFSLVEKNQKT